MGIEWLNGRVENKNPTLALAVQVENQFESSREIVSSQIEIEKRVIENIMSREASEDWQRCRLNFVTRIRRKYIIWIRNSHSYGTSFDSVQVF